ncbi:MAG: hypothetical protein DKINENOH_04028 [bacterium]|nr:hypothetical protein [bacterium]MCK6562542.1 MerR family transcriptional regulator [bacterium]NUM65415.1 MerR family transcriptional regulator [candidate division KSB1 bacterium]
MPSTTNKARLKIRQVAAQLDIAVETIRMYEREGLLLPAKTASGQRWFEASDLHWLGCLRRLIKEQGLNLAGIRRLLALMPCWDLKPCSPTERESCPAYLGEKQPCWMMKARLPQVCQAADCRSCLVYQNASHCENLKTLLQKNAKRNQESYGRIILTT